jgi:hypothetical protein
LLRPIRLFLTGFALFVGAAGAGVLVASHWGPERTRAVLETSLSEALDRPVAVEGARLYFGGGPLSWMTGVLLDAEGIVAEVPGAAGLPELSVERLQAELDPISLLSGRVEVRSVALDGLRATLGADGGGAKLSEELSIPAPAEDAEPIVGWLEAVARAAEEMLAAPLREGDVSLARTELLVRGPALVEGGEPWVLELRDVSGEGRLRRPGQRSALSLTGRLVDGGDDARIAIELERTPRGEIGVGVSVADLELGYAGPALRALWPTVELSGRSDLELRIDRPQADVWRVSAHVDGRACEGSVPRMGDGHPVPVALDGFAAGLDVDLDPERLRLERAFVSARGSEIELAGEIGRPLRPASSTVGRLSLDRYDLAHRDDLIAFLPPGQIAKLQTALEPLRSGRVEDVRVEGTAPLRDWLRAFDDERRGLLPDSVEATAHFTGFAVRAGEDETITDLSGDVSWRGDRLALRGVRGRRAGHWLPLLDATLTGVSNLAANRGVPEIPNADDAPVMLGLGPMYDIVVDPNKPPGEMPKELLLALDHLVHPTLVWPVRNLFVRASPREEGIRLLLEHGVWGRVPVRAEGIWAMQRSGPRRVEHVAVNVDVKPPLDGLAPLDLASPIWARGRWHVDAHNLGDWRVLSSTGAFEAEGQDVRLASYDLDLGIAGHALGEAVVDFSGPVDLPYRTDVRMVGAQAEGVVDKIGFEPDEATGQVEMEGTLHGELRPGRRVLAGMEGTLQIRARDGAILKRLPALLAMAKVTDTFNPFGSRDEMRYSEIDALLRLERGTVHAEELRISGRDLRLLATGQVDAVDPEHPVEAVVGVFFFRAIDRVIGVVPVLSDLILGEDEGLMGAYVQLTGPWASPDADLVPLKTVASGPASFAIEGVPRFVKRAITAIQSAFSRPEVSAPPPSSGVSAPPPSRGEDS